MLSQTQKLPRVESGNGSDLKIDKCMEDLGYDKEYYTPIFVCKD
jgi:hypothetical protein